MYDFLLNVLKPIYVIIHFHNAVVVDENTFAKESCFFLVDSCTWNTILVNSYENL